MLMSHLISIITFCGILKEEAYTIKKPSKNSEFDYVQIFQKEF